MPLKYPNDDLVWLYLYFMTCLLTVINHWWFVSNEPSIFGSAIVTAHLVFNIVGTFAFALIGSPFLYYAYAYRHHMSVRAHRDYGSLCSSITFLLHDLPLWILELWMCWRWGWISVIQGVSLVVLSVSFALGFLGTWLGYAWFVAKFLQTYFGETAFNYTTSMPVNRGRMYGDPNVARTGGEGGREGYGDSESDEEMDGFTTPGRAVAPAYAASRSGSRSARAQRYNNVNNRGPAAGVGPDGRRLEYIDRDDDYDDEEEEDEEEEDEEDEDEYEYDDAYGNSQAGGGSHSYRGSGAALLGRHNQPVQ